MSTIRKMIESKSLQMLGVCILPLCLIVPALSAAATPANPAARADGLLRPMISQIIDPPDIPLPKPPPSCPGTTAMEQTA